MEWTRQNRNSSTVTVAWTVVQRVCPLPMKSLRTIFVASARAQLRGSCFGKLQSHGLVFHAEAEHSARLTWPGGETFRVS